MLDISSVWYQFQRWILLPGLPMSLLTEDFKESPLWVDEVAPWDDAGVDLPARVDVLVVGAGYTGLNAAIETARGARSTLVSVVIFNAAACFAPRIRQRTSRPSCRIFLYCPVKVSRTCLPWWHGIAGVTICR